MTIVKPRVPSGREPPAVEPFEGLELYDGKLSRAVLRGGGAAMPFALPGADKQTELPPESPDRNRKLIKGQETLAAKAPPHRKAP